MRYLWTICKNLRSKNCNSTVSLRTIPAGPMKNAGPIHKQPTGEEAKQLDEICSKCDHRFLEIQEEECPVCMKNNAFTKIIIPDEPAFQTNKSGLTEYLYKCTNCSTKLYSEKNYKLKIKL